MPSLRRAIPDDEPTLVALAEAAYIKYVERVGRPPAPMVADYGALIRDAEVWVVEVAGETAGLLVLILAPDHLLLDNVAVWPDRQGTGLGALLLDHAEARAQALGLAEVRLYTSEKMIENIEYYQCKGYRETHRGIGMGFNRVYFTKTLKNCLPE